MKLKRIFPTKYSISTPLMMENPVRRPMVPPIADNMSTNFAALSFSILSNVGVSKNILTDLKPGVILGSTLTEEQNINLEYEWKNNLRFVRIYFDTPTFDRIEKDRAAKFVDMLSAIGGTMGLLTGFSIISAVEIIYFATKFGWSVFQKKKNQNDKIISIV